MEGSFKEANDLTVTLPEDNPATFERFMQWLYSERFEVTRQKWRELIDLYILSDKLGVVRLQYLLISMLIKRVNNKGRFPHISVAKKIYTNTPDGSPLRKLMVAIWANNFSMSNFRTENQKELVAHPEFAKDLLVALAMRICGSAESAPRIKLDEHDFLPEIKDEADQKKLGIDDINSDHSAKKQKLDVAIGSEDEEGDDTILSA